jgi:hypothetical protein
MAEEAVTSEPVSASNSLLTGKNTGNIFEFGFSGQASMPQTPQIQRLDTQFPTKNNSEFSSGIRER